MQNNFKTSYSNLKLFEFYQQCSNIVTSCVVLSTMVQIEDEKSEVHSYRNQWLVTFTGTVNLHFNQPILIETT